LQIADFGLLHAVVSEHVLDARQLRGCNTGEEVVQGQHRVGLAAAEVGLQLDHGVSRLAGEAPQRADQQPAQTVRVVGDCHIGLPT
jgi:hypothetical protein